MNERHVHTRMLSLFSLEADHHLLIRLLESQSRKKEWSWLTSFIRLIICIFTLHSSKAAYTYTKWTPNKHSSANLVCLPNGFVKNCLTSTNGECEQTNRHTVIGAKQTSLMFAQFTNIRGNATKCERKHSPSLVCFCCTIHISPILGNECVCSVFVWYMCTRLKADHPGWISWSSYCGRAFKGIEEIGILFLFQINVFALMNQRSIMCIKSPANCINKSLRRGNKNGQRIQNCMVGNADSVHNDTKISHWMMQYKRRYVSVNNLQDIMPFSARMRILAIKIYFKTKSYVIVQVRTWCECKASWKLRHSVVWWSEITHQEFLWNTNMDASVNVGMQGETTHFLCKVITRRSKALLQISRCSRYAPSWKKS